jgi:peptide deformylase
MSICWSTEDPPLHARYRLEWRFRARDTQDAGEHTASETMRALGIVQEGDPILTSPARPFALPEEAEDARRVVAELQSTAARVADVHTFGKGLGIAAPQIGIDRAAAIVRPPGGDTITLLNPRIVEESTQSDEQYEGCLSFFDVRGLVAIANCADEVSVKATFPNTENINVEGTDLPGTQAALTAKLPTEPPA